MRRIVGMGLVAGLLIVGEMSAWGIQSPQRWDLRVGYGYQYTNRSRPNNFQIISVLPSVMIPITETRKWGWLRGRLDWNPELDLALFNHPYVRPKIGLTPLQFHWEFETSGRWHPYLVGGLGVLWANVNRRETRSDWNFNVQGGVGLYYDLSKDASLILEYRHVHISNAGLHEDNAGINTHNFLLGVSIRR